MIIDVHAHVGDFRWSRNDPREPMTWDRLIARLDDEGIDRAVLLPVYNASPELTPWGFFHSERQFVRDQVVDAAQYAGRVIPFGNMDPRWGGNSEHTDFGEILDWFQERGCRGMGELCANVPYDDPRNVNMFGQMGARGLLATVESCDMGWGLGYQDEPGSPHLERLLQAAPDTILIGHGPAFWAEIAVVSGPEGKRGYHRGRIEREGSLWRLMRAYPNLCADLSAASSFNALSRDLEAGVRFLNEFPGKLMFGTDIIARDMGKRDAERKQVNRLLDELLSSGSVAPETWAGVTWHNGVMPQLDYLKALRREGMLGDDAYAAIVGGNAARLLRL